MSSIVERLRQHALPDPHDEREVMHAPLLKEAADLIEQQAERIKELEAEQDQLVSKALYEMKCFELAALRQRIADAPVVAWMGEYNINDIRDHYTVVMRHKTDFDGMPERVRALVFKEDLL